jgi:hypothetical protein
VAKVVGAHRAHRQRVRAQQHLYHPDPIQQQNESHADQKRSRRRTSGAHRHQRLPVVRHLPVLYYWNVPSRTVAKSTNTLMGLSIIRVMRMERLMMMTLRKESLVCRRTMRAISRRRVLPRRWNRQRTSPKARQWEQRVQQQQVCRRRRHLRHQGCHHPA